MAKPTTQMIVSDAPSGCMFYRFKHDLYMHGPDGWQKFMHFSQQWEPISAIYIPGDVLRMASETIKAEREAAAAV